MFTYQINNPNDFVIENENYNVIPFGHRCTSALACKYANMRKYSLPFDWTIPLFPGKTQKILHSNFAEFIPDVHNNIFKNMYGVELAHFNENKTDGINEYKRRIERFNSVINEPKKIYFIYINDDYLYDNKYRTINFNDRIFNEMLNLEKFLRTKYTNINYNILYFNFKKDDIPQNSNIINIVLSTDTFYNSWPSDYSVVSNFRNYCGKILSELFNTKYDGNGHHNDWLINSYFQD